MAARYPPPPWRAHGRAFFQPFVVRADALRLPDGLEPRAVTGRALGLLGFVEYLPPSPLVYRELVWMPCLASLRTRSGKRVSGYFVERMYVDSEASRDGGREIWALPKQLARFEVGDTTVAVEAEDGARLVLERSLRGPALGGPPDIATLQDAGEHFVRFRGTGTAKLRSARLTVREARGCEAWAGFADARRIPALGAALIDFAMTMREPVRIERP